MRATGHVERLTLKRGNNSWSRRVILHGWRWQRIGKNDLSRTKRPRPVPNNMNLAEIVVVACLTAAVTATAICAWVFL